LINSRTGTLEVKVNDLFHIDKIEIFAVKSSNHSLFYKKEIDRKILSEPATVFFHISVLWVAKPNGNPFGPPVQFTSLLTDGVSLKTCLPVGTR